MRNKYGFPCPQSRVDKGRGVWGTGSSSRTSRHPHPLPLHGPPLHVGQAPPGAWMPLDHPCLSLRHHGALFSFPSLLILQVSLPPKSLQPSPAPRVCRLHLLSSKALVTCTSSLTSLLEAGAQVPRQSLVQGPFKKDVLDKALLADGFDKHSKVWKWKFKLTSGLDINYISLRTGAAWLMTLGQVPLNPKCRREEIRVATEQLNHSVHTSCLLSVCDAFGFRNIGLLQD